jgi:hypothetical protein
MKLSGTSAVGAYAAVMTLAVMWLALGAAMTPRPAQFGEIDVERINIREPDGTLRLAIANHARMPGIIIAGREYPHPNRTEAGMIFYNDEGTENGGLVFNGGMANGRAVNGGSLTFDRWHQDQTIQMSSEEDGQDRQVAFRINDRPDRPMDFARVEAVRAMPDGPAKTAAYKAAGFDVAQRVYLGRAPDKASQLVLRDAAGRQRLVLRVEADGAAKIEFLDAAGRPARTIAANLK